VAVGIIDTVKSWFNKEESRMLGQDVERDASHASQHYSDDAKAHMNERIVEEEEEE
jgi:hypothetical protein